MNPLLLIAAGAAFIIVPSTSTAETFSGRVKSFDAKTRILTLHNNRRVKLSPNLAADGLKPEAMVTIGGNGAPNHRIGTTLKIGNYH